MPSVNDIVAVAEALEKSPIAVLKDRCVAVRNRNATCRRCVEACATGAIDVCGNEVTLSASLCTGCGACAVSCPTEALQPLNPSNEVLDAGAVDALGACGDVAAIACARISSKRQADPAKYAEVACLSRVDEALLLTLAANGANRILLVDGDCPTCKYRAASQFAGKTVREASELLASHGSSVEIDRITGFPAAFAPESPDNAFGTTRRGFFSDAVGAAKETAMTAAKTTVAKELGIHAAEASIGERLRVTDEGTLPLIDVPRHDAAINALDAIGHPVMPEIDSRLFATVEIDTTKCNSCGMCSVFCPTGALRRDADEKVGEPIRTLEFNACDCIQCNLCEDVCWKKALELKSAVPASELYSFEPKLFHLADAKRASFAG